jgi:hypothetical protein
MKQGRGGHTETVDGSEATNKKANGKEQPTVREEGVHREGGDDEGIVS